MCRNAIEALLARCWRCCAQARRLVKSSIIAVDAPDEDVGEDDYVDDAAEFEEVAGRHREGGAPNGDGGAGGGGGGGGGQPPGDDEGVLSGCASAAG